MNTSMFAIFFLLVFPSLCECVCFQDRTETLVFRELVPFPRLELGRQVGLQALEVANLATDCGDAISHQLGDLGTRLWFLVEGVQTGPNEFEREALPFGSNDQAEASQVDLTVLAITALAGFWLRHQALRLVETNATDADPCRFCQLTNAHLFQSTA